MSSLKWGLICSCINISALLFLHFTEIFRVSNKKGKQGTVHGNSPDVQKWLAERHLGTQNMGLIFLCFLVKEKIH